MDRRADPTYTLIWEEPLNAARGAARTTFTKLATPVLGGTPSRATLSYWEGTNNWISAKDITSAANSVIYRTVESISNEAISKTRAKPLPAGSAIVTARGTVGSTARLAESSSFNQSCYGFTPTPELPSALLFQMVNYSVAELRQVAYGSVFDSITTQTLESTTVPLVTAETHPELSAELTQLQDQVISLGRENQKLAELRDYLLPRLMSGKITIRDAESLISS